MLVLSRKVGERVLLDDNVEIEILSIQGNRIRLGIVAPVAVKILRGELRPLNDDPAKDVAQEGNTARAA